MDATTSASAESCDIEPTLANLQRLILTDDAAAALDGTHVTTLRLGHNYIGTEHLLLGIVSAEGSERGTS